MQMLMNSYVFAFYVKYRSKNVQKLKNRENVCREISSVERNGPLSFAQRYSAQTSPVPNNWNKPETDRSSFVYKAL